MHVLVDPLWRFVVENLPTPRLLALGGPLALAWAFAVLALAGRLKRRGVRTGYTRKLFHFAVFTTAAVLQWRAGTRAVCLMGAMASLAVFYAVWRGPGHPFYEALAREKDAPRRTFFILVPYFTTLVGGVAANVLFGPAALAGYLVAGLGDAIGEPVGVWLGRHPYRVPSLRAVPASRTLEGSLAVFIASGLSILLAAAMSPTLFLGAHAPVRVLAIAAASTLAEALSPHGWDNAVLQVLPAGLAAAWLT